MKNIMFGVFGVILGIIIGGLVNMGLIIASPGVIPLPEGVDPMDPVSLAENIHRFSPQNFLMPFLAHALGTLVGAFIAGLMAKNNKLVYALIIGGFFLIGGAMNVSVLPAPIWFNITDLVLAYIPMAFGGYLLSVKVRG